MNKKVHFTYKVNLINEMNNRLEDYLDDIPPFKDI